MCTGGKYKSLLKISRRACPIQVLTEFAVNDPFLDSKYAAYQFKYESVYGTYPEEVTVDGGCLVIGNVRVKFFSKCNRSGEYIS